MEDLHVETVELALDYMTDPRELERLKHLAEQGDARAQIALAGMYYDGRGVDQNFQEAFRLYRKAAAQGEAGAQYALGGMYYLGQCVQKDLTEAANWFKKAASQNHPEAQRALGFAYDRGQGVPRNREEAIKWFSKAARMGHKGALKTLKKMGVPLDDEAASEPMNVPEPELEDLDAGLQQKSEPPQKSPEEAEVDRLIELSHQGDPESQYKLSRCYYRGIGAPQDTGAAQKWLERAATKGHVEAQFSLGVMHYKEAVKWFQRAAESGSDRAQFSLAVMYLDGRGVQRDRSQAIRWFRESARQGNRDAEKQLEKMGES
jgi:hypothetical protein